jgi:uncharacterized membrane protein YkoI
MTAEVLMRKLNVCSGVASLAWALMFASVSCAENEKEGAAKRLEPADVPQKVMAAAKGRFPGAQFHSIEKENEDGKVIYDFELTQDGRKYEMDILDDGTIIEIEKALDAGDRPDNVTKLVMDKWPKASIKEVMEKSIIKDGKESVHEYEVVLRTPDGKTQEVTVSKDGKITEEAAGEDENGNEDDDKGKADDDDKREKK